jgi:hypothetical protein
LEARVATLEMELIKHDPSSLFTADHGATKTAAVDALTEQYPMGPYEGGSSARTVVPPDAGTGAAIERTGRERAASGAQPEEDGEGEDDLAVGIGLLSLTSGGESIYVGASSGVNWARVCAT